LIGLYSKRENKPSPKMLLMSVQQLDGGPFG
jgi:hypothetical protein